MWEQKHAKGTTKHLTGKPFSPVDCHIKISEVFVVFIAKKNQDINLGGPFCLRSQSQTYK